MDDVGFDIGSVINEAKAREAILSAPDEALPDIPEAMAKSLKEDVFVFSGLKTHAQLAEASKLLMTADGKIKSFSA